MWILTLLLISYSALGQVRGCVEVSLSDVNDWSSNGENHYQKSVDIVSSCDDDICDVDLAVSGGDTIYNYWNMDQESSSSYSLPDWVKWNPLGSFSAGIIYTGDDEPEFTVAGYTTCDGETVTDVTPAPEVTTTTVTTTTTSHTTATTTSGPTTTSSEMCLLGDYASGVTTRYWDCCKVSCAWSGKIYADGQQVDDWVDTCESDGTTVLSGNSDTSGCQGGNAYTCTNNMPWAVTDNLAYGYVAAAVPDQDETQFCCGCYHVKFTSTSIAGKEMIVQVTNIGYDLSSGGHFDIQMPGGGVGLFDGCSSQWGSGYDWGATYGGISSQDECDNLPSELSDGCNWRFDWFENADNPDMEYAPVECPQELIDNSGCERPDWSC